MKTGFQRTNK